MAMARWMDNDNDFFANPFRSLIDPRGFMGPSLLTGGGANGHGFPSMDMTPIKVDVLEKEDRFTVKADVPGIPKERVHLSVDGDLLNLSIDNETAQEKEENVHGYKVHRIERSTSFARRVIRLPDSADTDRISAHVEHGVLGIDIPKKLTAHQRRRQIDIGSSPGIGSTSIPTGGIHQQHASGIPQQHTGGVTQQHASGVPLPHTSGVTQQHASGIPQQHTGGVTQQHAAQQL